MPRTDIVHAGPRICVAHLLHVRAGAVRYQPTRSAATPGCVVLVSALFYSQLCYAHPVVCTLNRPLQRLCHGPCDRAILDKAIALDLTASPVVLPRPLDSPHLAPRRIQSSRVGVHSGGCRVWGCEWRPTSPDALSPVARRHVSSHNPARGHWVLDENLAV